MTCDGCKGGAKFQPRITMAFQPIINVFEQKNFAYEALVRGINGEGAGEILDAVTSENRYAFDQRCRVTAIELASEFNLSKQCANIHPIK